MNTNFFVGFFSIYDKPHVIDPRSLRPVLVDEDAEEMSLMPLKAKRSSPNLLNQMD